MLLGTYRRGNWYGTPTVKWNPHKTNQTEFENDDSKHDIHRKIVTPRIGGCFKQVAKTFIV